VKIKTTRFGELQVENNDILNFKDGLLGFDSLKQYFIVDPGDSTLILWLQSVEDNSVAFPIIEPKIFKPDYVAKLVPNDLSAVELESLSNARIYSILTIPADITAMSANLKAPIVINNTKKVAKQVVLQDSKLPVGFEMYKELKKYIVAYSSDDSVRTAVSTPEVQKQDVTTATDAPVRTINTDRQQEL
jgi:flagellar assembly factor FliW